MQRPTILSENTQCPKESKLRPGSALILPNVRPVIKDDRASEKLRQLQLPKRIPTSVDAWQAVLATLPENLGQRALKSQFWTQGEEILLSSKTPVYKNRGHIRGLQIQAYAPADSTIWFDWQAGKLEIWLTKLELSGTYMMEIRCSVYNGELKVGASDAPHAIMPAQGQDHRIWVVIDKPDYEKSLVTLDGHGADNWCFYDARVWRLE